MMISFRSHYCKSTAHDVAIVFDTIRRGRSDHRGYSDRCRMATGDYCNDCRSLSYFYTATTTATIIYYTGIL